MTNKQLCNLLELVGCTVGAVSLGLMFFGVGAAIWGVAAGVGIAAVGLVNYD